ncbi:MAG: Gfo/Idh/MocA family oxidoreductase [Pseudomonadales bacterium]|nr:Gfo/Idh/MocA family oxidoreductase [Pseudomonadales bacterium]
MKVVIIGAGQIAEAHIIELQKIPGVEVVGLCDLFASPLLALKEKFGIPHTSTKFDELLDVTKPDVVHITTPPSSHLFLTKQSIDAGAHVYIEKPLTVTYDETKELLEYAEKHDKKLCIGSFHKFDRAQKHASKLIETDELGKIAHIDCVFSYDLQGIFGRQVMSNPDHWIAKLPGQIFQNNLNHPLTPILPFLSDNYSVRAWADDWTGNGVVFEELRVEIYDHDNKFTAYIVFTSNVKPGQFRISYYGSKKAVFLNHYNHTYVEDSAPKLPGNLGQIIAIRKIIRNYSKLFWKSLYDFVFGKVTYFTSMNEMIQLFYDAIQKGTELPISVAELDKASNIIEQINKQIGRPEDRDQQEACA